MKRVLALLGLICAAFLASVTEGQAAVTTNTTVPIDLFVGIPCTGDVVALTGPLHILSTFTINNNRVSGTDLFQPEGVTGTDLTTGAIYQATGETRDAFSASLINGQSESTFVNNFKIIGHNSASYLVHENAHVTVNANGTVTASVDNVSVTCR